ncbi:hypothetical protein [Aquitalea magnusonii]|uniref:Uncharacterized protein n=1 Tax=Aquitalea magnusonii TaxID=332411 RepID=A0A318JPJ6_9NEIS|nr:hypothetical protein [Aquitalea magnusonii]PXX51109.1 hypothetical protein DFR38_101170 [Aquitalea magnusonii]
MFLIDDLIYLGIHAATIQVQFLGGIPSPNQEQVAQVAVKPIVSMFSAYRECIYEGVVVPYSKPSPGVQEKDTIAQTTHDIDGRALIVYKRQCPDKAAEKLFLAGEAKSISVVNGKDMVFVKEFNPVDVREPAWMAQVMNTLRHSDSTVASEFRTYANLSKLEPDNVNSTNPESLQKANAQEEIKQ